MEIGTLVGIFWVLIFDSSSPNDSFFFYSKEKEFIALVGVKNLL